ncbi:helix-turn-helix domain-containing protein [Streptomyces sp. TG1A-8]|uniref:helix-turn-helix domain-containing protein n=1 Tax=Streptomyces sp. TG1A-8 TaxID=3051385 RepID=UPI00265BB586|nr:helix-turn-helix domain-containing protein [Streptomyces sp. TG1A-8]MDO0927339.1 helix-turn-helix domain-containing protein [Streptomyces sp. TG1A-8]
MTPSSGKYADFEGLRERAVALRRGGHGLRRIGDELGVRDKDVLSRLVKGEAPPEWTKRPRAKDDLRERARALRLQGWTYDRIRAELGCSKSSVSLWVRDLPRPEPTCTPEERQARMNAGLARLHAARDQERRAAKQAAAEAVGALSDREPYLAGVALYWAEGTKDKPHARRQSVEFVNSDPGVIGVFLAWLDLLGVGRDRLHCRVVIHDSADVAAAERHWADLVGRERSDLGRTVLKRYGPKTVRKNTGESYRGCLGIEVRRGADLYRRVEGAWYGIVGAVLPGDASNRT